MWSRRLSCWLTGWRGWRGCSGCRVTRARATDVPVSSNRIVFLKVCRRAETISSVIPAHTRPAPTHRRRFVVGFRIGHARSILRRAVYESRSHPTSSKQGTPMLTRSILSAAAFSLAACATAPSIAQDNQGNNAGNNAFAETGAQGRPVKVMIITMFGPEGVGSTGSARGATSPCPACRPITRTCIATSRTCAWSRPAWAMRTRRRRSWRSRSRSASTCAARTS